MEKNVNISVDEGDAFFCHELSVNFNPMQFVLDFKSVTPRVDLRSKNAPIINIKHNVVMVDPYHAKNMLNLLSKVIGDYEREFGEIIKPEAIEKAEKKMKSRQDDDKKTTVAAPSYFG